MNKIKSTLIIALSFILVAGTFAVAPLAHAQDFGGFDSFGDASGCCSLDYGSVDSFPADYGYVDSYAADYGSVDSFPADYGYVDSYPGYSTPSYSSPYSSTPSYSTPAYSTPAYTAPHFAAPSYYTPSPTFNPYIVQPAQRTPTVAATPSNILDSFNSCVQTNSCSTTTSTTVDDHSVVSLDDHSVVNANTTINSPTTITTTNPAPQNTQIVYNSPTPAPYQQPVYQQPTYYTPTPTYTAPAPVYQAPRAVTYNNPTTPYVTLSQVPYTGLELGPIGTVIYWSFLVLACLLMAFLIVVKRVHLTLASYLKTVLFGSEGEVSESNVAQTRVMEYSAPRAVSMDATDDFIQSQIHRHA